ncbi:hypothetical protein WCX72_09780 [Sulfurimonas sp. HSL1-6]|uniref:hypothetical protein n=1 Tax=Thiomicrolovo immobilis TaxID=3131935 RepID=UPI0031F930FA
MKLEGDDLPLLGDDVLTAKLRLLRGVWRVDTYGVPVRHNRMRYVYFDPDGCRFYISEHQRERMLAGVRWGDAPDGEAAVMAVATRYSLTVIMVGALRRRLLGERTFLRYVHRRPDWFS